MALKNLLESARKKGYVVGPLDMYLMRKAGESEGRAIDVNAPSSAGACLRSSYYRRKQYPSDAASITPKVQRIFDNGTHVHIRLQEYLSDMGMLIVDEVPLINNEYNIQGHTDGFLELSEDEVGILEIKSINEYRFKELRSPMPHHVLQGIIYVFCAEERRKWLREHFESLKDYYDHESEMRSLYEKYYQHLTGGRKFDRAAKIKHEVEYCLICDDILLRTERPVTKAVFLYECKNNQELKEFVISSEDKDNQRLLDNELRRYDYLDKCCHNEEVPEREGESKSCQMCRWCDFKNTCWVM